jgi:hypothetical protein
VAALAARETDRASAHLLRVRSVRLSPERSDATDLPRFLQESQLYQTDLAAGRIVAR